MTTPPLLLSHARGTTTPPLQDCTIGQALDATVARHGDREALVVPHQGVRWTWRQLAQQADAVAAGLAGHGPAAGRPGRHPTPAALPHQHPVHQRHHRRHPKGATLTHRNILNNGFFVGEACRLTEHDRLCIPVPLYHCFGMVMGNLAA
jgi:acyl-CoA synthetase (AMP-forming)/AMP-acid ligase II